MVRGIVFVGGSCEVGTKGDSTVPCGAPVLHRVMHGTVEMVDVCLLTFPVASLSKRSRGIKGGLTVQLSAACSVSHSVCMQTAAGQDWSLRHLRHM